MALTFKMTYVHAEFTNSITVKELPACRVFGIWRYDAMSQIWCQSGIIIQIKLEC